MAACGFVCDLLAMLVLSVPGEVPLDWPAPEIVRRLAAVAEIVDDAEKGPSIRLLAERWVDLRDAPPLVDLGRFPSREQAILAAGQCRAFAEFCDANRLWHAHHWDAWTAVYGAALRVARAWCYLADAGDANAHVPARRRDLRRFREELGAMNYAAGRVPSPVTGGR